MKYLLCWGAACAYPFVWLWRTMCNNKHIIAQALWTLIFGLCSGYCLLVTIAGVVIGAPVIACMSAWCYFCCTNAAMYDYNYIIRRFF